MLSLKEKLICWGGVGVFGQLATKCARMVVKETDTDTVVVENVTHA